MNKAEQLLEEALDRFVCALEGHDFLEAERALCIAFALSMLEGSEAGGR